MKPTINFIFSVGYRCYSPDFLKMFGLRKMSGPLDYMFIDLESALHIISNKFDNYLHDLILINKSTNTIELHHKKHTININQKLCELFHSNISYMNENYDEYDLVFNQNYIDNVVPNLYEWDRICLSIHHNTTKEDIRKTIQTRCDRFNKIIESFNDATALLYITKIVESNIPKYIENVVMLKKQYNITCYLVVIINSDSASNFHYFDHKNKCLFIIKKVETYAAQILIHKTDNNFIYDKEYGLLRQYFNFELIEKSN